MAQVRRARAATPCRRVSGARGIMAVFNRPEKPKPCRAALRASSVKRRITGVTRTNWRSLVRNSSKQQMRNVQVVEGSLMEDFSVPAGASEPRGDGGLTVAEDSFGGGSVHPFCQCVIRTIATRHGRGFSNGTGACAVEH